LRSSARFQCIVIITLILLGAPLGAMAQPMDGIAPSELFPGARFDPSIPSQAEAIGFQPGARPLRHAELIAYLEALDAASDRARLVEYSRTHEGRPMVYLAISDPATVGELDSFRDEHRRLLDPRESSGDGAALDQAKAVAWLAYGIHGDELSSPDAAAALAYWLVAGEDERAQTLRRELLILIDPCENPDGRERFLAQTFSFAHSVPNPDQDDLSHTTVWPWGRGNHYLFDLNRDWFSMVHPESRRSMVISSWNPQLVVDSHEMGSNDTYLFSPPREPFNPLLPPSTLEWADRFAADQARALDARGYPYYTREWNEEFFPGYGSSWSSYLGAVGILYEMSGTEGTLVLKRSGTTRTFAQAVEHQTTSSVANVETLAANRTEILRDTLADRSAAIRAAREGGVAAWVFPRGRQPERTDALAALLQKQGIEVLRSTGSTPQVSGLHDIRTGAAPAQPLDNGAWLVRLDQPAGPLAAVILDPHVPMQADFLRLEREYQERGRGTRLYEVTSWSLPLLWDVEAYWTRELPGDGWAEAQSDEPAGRFERATDAVGYVMAGTSDRSVAALADLLQRGLTVRVAEKPFGVDGVEYERGSLLIQREDNPDDVEQQLEEVAQRWNVVVRAIGTGKAETGPDLGGRYFRILQEPRVGIWTGSPVSSSDYGALWHLLDEDMRLRFSGLDVGLFGRIDLSRYNVLIFPPARGGANAYRGRLGQAGVERLKRWVEAGGTVIGIGGGADFLADESNELTRTRLRRQALDRYPPVVLGPDAGEAQVAGGFRAAGIPAAEPPAKQDGDDGKKKKAAASEPPAPIRTSPYDVAPMLGAGARPFAEGVDKGTQVEMRPIDLAEWVKPYLAPGQGKPAEEDLARADERLRRFSPRGALLRVELDPEVWLTWGMADEVPALIRARDTLVAEPPVQVGARFADVEQLHLGGLLWPEAAARLAHTAYATRESVGRGQVILFADTPEFRGWTKGTRRLLQNAILYGPGLGTRWSRPW